MSSVVGLGAAKMHHAAREIGVTFCRMEVRRQSDAGFMPWSRTATASQDSHHWPNSV